MGTLSRAAVAALVLASALVAGSSATASRQPTLKEREALTAALPQWLQKYPVGCVWLDITVSNNGEYAIVGPVFLNALHEPCLRYASNGLWILKRSAHWKIIFNGSDPPACSLEIPKDLVTGCLRR